MRWLPLKRQFVAHCSGGRKGHIRSHGEAPGVGGQEVVGWHLGKSLYGGFRGKEQAR